MEIWTFVRFVLAENYSKYFMFNQNLGVILIEKEGQKRVKRGRMKP